MEMLLLPQLIDLFHLGFIFLLIVCTPFLFLKKWRWRKIRIWTTCYAIAFVLINRVGHWIWGECFLTRLARLAGGSDWGDELFLSKISRMFFGSAPSADQLLIFEQAAMGLVCLGILISLLREWRKL
jgi:hypothetical protein